MRSDLPTVLIVDDSALIRTLLAGIVEASGEFRVAGTAAHGLEAIRQVHALDPALVTLDVQMPVLDGLQTLGYIMSEAPRPVVMLAAREAGGRDLAMRALELGAVDFVAKPGPGWGLDADALRERVLAALRGAAAADVRAAQMIARPRATGLEPVRGSAAAAQSARRVVAIAASTGGPRALAEIIPALPADLGAAVLVVQHLPTGFTESLAQRLDRASALPVAEARQGDQLLANRVYIAPGGRHMSVGSGNPPCILLGDDPPVWGMRPAADVLFRSVAERFGSAAVGVVLTGMGRDGAEGLQRMRTAGAWVLVQDRGSSIVYGMPGAALALAEVDGVVPAKDMAREISLALQRRGGRVTGRRPLVSS